MKRPAVFLDRDGTLNVDVGYAHRVEQLALIEGVLPGLRKLQALGFALVVVTNQSGIARGYFGEAELQAFHQALTERLKTGGVELTAIYSCPFHPTEGQGRYRVDSPLRKPAPGMLLQAASDLDLDLAASFAIGDKLSDVLAGQRAGCRTVLVQTGASGAALDDLGVRPDYVAANLPAAAEWIELRLREKTGVPHFLDCAYPSTANCPSRVGDLG